MYNLFDESTLMFAVVGMSLYGIMIYAKDQTDCLTTFTFENYIYIKTNLKNINNIYVLPILKGMGFGKEDSLIFIKDGKEILKIKTEKYDSIKDSNNDDFDMIFRCIPNEDANDEQEYDVKICKKLSDIEDEFVMSNVSFLSPKVQISYIEDDDEFEEYFEFDDLFSYNNLYMEKNELFCYEFIEWYLFKNKEFVLKSEDKYKVSFIDHNMNVVELSNGETILIEKDDYIIKDGGCKNNEEVVEEEEQKLMSKEDELSRENNKVNENYVGVYNYWMY